MNRSIVLAAFAFLITFAIDTWASQPAANHSQEVHIDTIATVYKTESLVIRQISQNVYEHITFLNTNTFGRVSCNGMIVVANNEAVIFDTPASNKDSAELLEYLTKQLNINVKAIIAAHFHEDCLGGLATFHKYGIASYANKKTIQSAKELHYILPQNSFDGHLTIKVGNKKVYTEFFGEGHTRDNVVGYFPDDNILFGGCLIKELNATKGNLADANTVAWPQTVRKIKAKYPALKYVIPGHGELGGTNLLDYTIDLFR
jgi:metallo-beta-lactamase class B